MSLKETDLHHPIKNWLETQNCAVKAEVKSIDMVGMFNELLIAVELKLKLNLEVINQAVERQSIADLVYIAVVHDFKAVESKRFKMTLLTLKRLNLGLLVVNFRATEPIVTELLKPEHFDFEKSKRQKQRKRAEIIKEFNRRSGDFNKAGSSKSKLMTAYREECIYIAYLIQTLGLSRAKEFEPYGIKSTKASSIMSKNFHGWFERIDKGLYRLSESGVLALEEYKGVVEFIIKSKEVKNDT
ncbi:DUF2161 family putative PD-(D/E)XK-type phosphodiesterase [Fusibacter bizertensis]|uniref:DUF2161 family putative PD-(D/E)XK-type phosphodiesterase n=1 Tax=Fusibacter bizertensis TaxID=1488331 RepID=A0ABT6NB38_9FIRM|nr:DUF2161 family putative PD-(D/E)XK-type phosphodiesterase [Fusibacter bizertensis]MDH8677627.1 DUF2161 family putative PD-(D/E)XK-type phosphodiesterase [Fusibacter bizertensis]